VKFSFERYRGASARILKERVAAVETPDPGRVRFVLKSVWPDFVTFYAAASGAGWIVPKKYVERVGDEGLRQRRPRLVAELGTRTCASRRRPGDPTRDSPHPPV